MREILFRGKDRVTREWRYGYVFDAGKNQMFVKTPAERTRDLSEQYSVDSETIGQYSGLKDKVGKKIFEGDVIDFAGDIEIVLFRHGLFGSMMPGFPRKRLSNWGGFVEHQSKVIGNKFDNPEFMEMKYEAT
jgi:uncharacterized phage protein (TIGR01671 family)